MLFLCASIMCQAPISEMTQPSLTQGIQGHVTQLRGDYMPRLSTSSESLIPNPSSNSKVQTQIWIFAGRIPGAGSPHWPVAQAAEHPSFLRSIESDAEGHYAIALDPGEYTVFAKYDDALYLNAFQGDGSFQSVTVNPEEIVNLDLVNTSGATF